MALKLELDAIDALPAEQQSLYKKTDEGKFRLDIEGGAVPKARLDEFRNTNIELLKKLEPYKDLDMAEIQPALEFHKKYKGKKPPKEEEIEEIVNERVIEMRNKYETETKAEREKRIKAEQQLGVVLIDNELQKEALASGALETALDDIVSRGRQVFRVVEGKVLPYDGDKVKYGEDGVTPLSVKAWLTQLSAKATHLFKGSKGGGADAGDRQRDAGSVSKKSDFKTATQKAQYIGKHGRDAYLKLPA